MDNAGGTLRQVLLFFLPLVTWVPAAFLIDLLTISSGAKLLTWAAYAVASVLIWDRILKRRKAASVSRRDAETR